MNNINRYRSELTKFEWNMLQIWIRKNYIPNAEYEYQVRVGKGASTEGVQLAWVRKCIKANSRLKIDCVVSEQAVASKIIEVKKVATPGAIGQLISYKYLFDKENGTDVSMLLLCSFASFDMQELCSEMFIEICEIEI